MADEDTPHLVSGFLGSAVGCGLVKVSAIAPGIALRWPGGFVPIWKYFPPISLIGAVAGGLLAAALAPAANARRSGDMAGVTVGLLTCLTMLPQRPAIFMIFLLTIAYGFVGFTAGSLAAGLKSTERPPS
jgi:hypothetical protein